VEDIQAPIQHRYEMSAVHACRCSQLHTSSSMMVLLCHLLHLGVPSKLPSEMGAKIIFSATNKVKEAEKYIALFQTKIVRNDGLDCSISGRVLFHIIRYWPGAAYMIRFLFPLTTYTILLPLFTPFALLLCNGRCTQ
jgi:hypothetical protein